MAAEGQFSPLLVDAAWFDENEQVAGWFDSDYLAPETAVGQGGDPAPLPFLGLLLGASSSNSGVASSSGTSTASALAGSIGSAAGVGTAAALRGSIGSAAGVGTPAALMGAIGASAGVGAAASLRGSIGASSGAGTPAALMGAIGSSAGVGAANAATGNVGTSAGTSTASALSGSIGASAGAATVDGVSLTGAGMDPYPLPMLHLGATGTVAANVGAASGTSTANANAYVVGSASGTATVDGHRGMSTDVTWDQVGGNEGYRVKWGLVSGGPYTYSADVATDVTTYLITGLEYNTTYYVVVYALVGGVEQDPSDEFYVNVGTAGAADATGTSTASALMGAIGSAAGSSTVDGVSTGSNAATASTSGTSTVTSLSGSIASASGTSAVDGISTTGNDGVGSASGAAVVSWLSGSIASSGGSASALGISPSTTPGTTPPVAGGGRPRRRRHYVEIDGQYFEVRDHQHAVEILTALRDAANEAAPIAVEQAAQVEKPVAVPVMRVVKPDYQQEFFQRLQAQVDATNAAIAREYASAQRSYDAWQKATAQAIVDNARAAAAKAEADEQDDIEALIALGVI